MRSISTRFLTVVGILAAAFSGALIIQTWWSNRIQLEKLIASKGELALEFDLAIRKYVAESIRPEMEKRIGADEFIPETMSTSFVARRVFEKVRTKYPDYILKFSSDNPRNPVNAAGPAELKVLEYFRDNPQAESWVGRIEMDGKSYVAHFSPRRMKEKCLRCHGRAEDAPESLLERYGSTAGFHRTVGDTIAMDTVAIPTDTVDATAAAQAKRQVLSTLVAISLLFGAIFIAFHRIVGRRLAAITDHFRQAAEKEQAGEQFSLTPVPTNSRDEIGVMANAYNALVRRSRRFYATLEQRVADRTQELQEEISRREQIEEHAARFGRVLECSLNEIYIFDADTLQFINVNTGARKNLGYTMEELRSLTPLDLKPEFTVESYSPLVEPLRSGRKEQVRFITVHRRKDGSRYPVEVHLQLISGRRPIFVAIVLDITERKQAEEKLQYANQRLEKQTAWANELAVRARAANAAKSEFLANMSHEIRTPMTAILGFSDVLMEATTNEEQLAAATTIKRNGEYLLGIINDILDVSKVEAGKLEIERLRCSPCQILSEVISLMRVRADAKNLPLKIEYDGPVPQTIQSDPTRLRQILINLTGNAVKFTEVGTIQLVVRLLDAESSEPKMQFAVMDTGVGMTDEQMARLFKPFQQADSSTTRKFGGTGLGLTISKRLAGMLGGDISVESVMGKGSTFTLTVAAGNLDGVPLLENPTDTSNSENADAPPNVPCDKLDCRVLLAEDGPDNQRLILFLLKKAGAEVELAENGQVALDLALAAQHQQAPFDVVLMDMQMPVMDGYDATTKLRQAGYDRPIVALTAHAMHTDLEKCLAAGCNAYQTKPINRRDLISVVARFASQAGHQEENAAQV